MKEETPAAPAAPALDKMTILFGGEQVPVRHRDGSAETVLVLLLPVDTYPTFASYIEDEVDQIALFCDKPRAWAAGLHPASHAEVIEKGYAINMDFFEQWVCRRLRARKSADPEGLTAKMEKAGESIVRELIAAKLNALSPSPISAPASLSAAASP